ncbi:MAG TPA: ester cyclase [Actinomycetota bacterium]|nr:ester cyclase [Actinomycetota bacterium]
MEARDGSGAGLREARIARVEEHIRAENGHDLDGVMATYAGSPRYEDEPYGERHDGAGQVRRYYERLLTAVPDLRIEVSRRHATEEAVILECVISGTHLGEWRGLPATGRSLRFPLCAVYTFDGDRLAGERIYYDRATVLRQVGMFHEPDTTLGRIVSALIHPVTMARVVARMARARRKG